MSKYFLSLIFIFLTGFGMSGMVSGTSVIDSLVIHKCSDFEITGNGHSDQWDKAEWINLPQPERDQDYDTKVKILYSATGIYFLYNCGDRKIISTMKADNLNLWEEDVVEAFLWTDEDFPVYFEYEISPANFELPIMVPNNKGSFLGWLPWHYEGERKTRHATTIIRNGDKITGWSAEFFIPYKLLAPLSNVPPVSGTRWRANMYRIDYDTGHEVPFAWQKVSNTFHEFKKFGTYIFE